VEELAPEAVLRNYAKEPLTRAEIQQILAAAGGVAPVLNTRHKTAKENGWKEKAPSKTAFVAAVLAEPNLLRRPLTVHDGSLVAGKDMAGIRALLK
jgi:arsenate reductase-like glutaredoxin family protein